MKQLDRFSKIELAVTKGLVNLYWIPSIIGIYLSHTFFTNNYEWFIKYPIDVGVAVLALFIGFGIIGSIGDVFLWIRKTFKMRSLSEIEIEVYEYEELNREKEEIKRMDWFSNKSSNDQRYLLYKLLSENNELTKKIHATIDVAKFAVILYLLYLAYSKLIDN